MYCSHLLALKELLNDEKIHELENYFSGLIGGATDNITVAKLSKAINISPQVASKVLTKCKAVGIVNAVFVIRCPECGMFIKKVNSISDIPLESFECYGCNAEIEIGPSDVEVIYSLSGDCVFIEGQQEEIDLSAKAVVPENSLESIFRADSINEYFFHPTEEEYCELNRMYVAIKEEKGTKKEKGDTLEDLTKYLFGLCSIFRTAGIKTSTNQIDCCVINKKYLDYGIFGTLGARFFIECKNEKHTPSGSYMSKLESIISTINAGGKAVCIKFGIIISKEEGPSTFKELAVKYYLSSGIVIISICGKELKEMFDNKGNLLDLIERKATEVMLDATTDLKKAGLYDS